MSLKRLNTHTPKFPTDTFFINSSRQLVENFLSDPKKIKELEARSTPRSKLRMQLFNLSPKYITVVEESSKPKISDKDPFISGESNQYK